MRGHWFVVASQKTVRIYTEVYNNSLRQLKEYDNPLGRLRNADLVKKNAGHGVKSLGHSIIHYSEKKRHDPHEEAAIQFAKELVHYLEVDYQNKNFTSLSIVAEPRFLGKLKAAMTSPLQALVTDWIGKDLIKTPQKELTEILIVSKKKKIENASFESVVK